MGIDVAAPLSLAHEKRERPWVSLVLRDSLLRGAPVLCHTDSSCTKSWHHLVWSPLQLDGGVAGPNLSGISTLCTRSQHHSLKFGLAAPLSGWKGIWVKFQWNCDHSAKAALDCSGSSYTELVQDCLKVVRPYRPPSPQPMELWAKAKTWGRLFTSLIPLN